MMATRALLGAAILFGAFLLAFLIPPSRGSAFEEARPILLRWLFLGVLACLMAWVMLGGLAGCAEPRQAPPGPPLRLLEPCPGGIPDPAVETGCRASDSLPS